jgi:hypothetical protein
MRFLIAVFFTALFSSGAFAQTGFDRKGGDYASFIVRPADPAVCASRCDRDNRCRAWSFSYPRTVTLPAMCWLKNDVPARTEANCCSSGVKGTGVIEPRTGPEEFSVDRVGGDYKNFDYPEQSPEICKTACEGDNRCRAWTYLRPGYGTPISRCYLKEHVTRPRPQQPCCISGVVR